ncbi:protein ZGRF1 isoform X7 [Marmota marmota marmota]|uniref:protein ZGRF1 isoform X7 n=1 Tax=Marmota marmota marmota TaxID=9994 RepID=UPI002092F7E2|nr:protein ZGRF1 isoform X7 [Marmota marmota marmota]
MENQEFIVLYTHQKMKKSKVWQDGILKITHLGNKAILYDDKGVCLENLFLKCLEVKPGDDLESERYLITVEEVKVSGSKTIKQNIIKEAPESDSRKFIFSGRSLGCQPAGLKRKFPGFKAPRQVPAKMIVTENGESAASLESKEPGHTFSSPFNSIPSLFSTVGKKDISTIPRDLENIVTYENRERNSMPLSSVVSTSSFMINPEMLGEKNYFCSPISTGSQHSDSSLNNEPLRRDNLASHYLRVSQNIRSKAQILALLKSKSTNMHKDLNSEMTRHLPQVQPQGSLNIPVNPKCLIQPEACAEMKSTENLYDQHQSENTMRNKSRWAMYLSSQSSPVHSSAIARKPFAIGVSQTIPKSPDQKQDSQQILKEDEVEPSEPFRSLQVKSPEQKFSTLSPVSTFSLNSRNEDVLEFSEESLKARTSPGMKKISSPKNKNLQRPPLVSRAGVPSPELPNLDSYSFVFNCDTSESSGFPTFNLQEESAVFPFSFGSEDQSETFSEEAMKMTPGDVSLINTKSQSKWLKYENTSQCNLTTPNRVDLGTDGFFNEAISGMHFSDSCEGQSEALNESSLDSVHLQMIKGMLYQQQQGFSSQDLVSRKNALSLSLKQTSKSEEGQNVLGKSTCYNYSAQDLQEINRSELCFPSGQKVKCAYLPKRQIHIPTVFQSPADYKQTFTSCIIEHLNILLFELAQRLHKALSKVDISFYTSFKGEKMKTVENNLPSCHHDQPAKLVMVKKEGPNKGRLFYTCDRPKVDQCKFFKWLEEVTPGWLTQEESQPSMVLNDIKSIALYLRSQKIPLYEECHLLVRKGFDFQRKQYGKLKKFTAVNPEFYSEKKSKLYLKLSRKESSSVYSKDDLWVISKTLDFELDTFIACSAFFGPSSLNEVELLPLKGYFPSNWPTNTVVHALLVCNASTELTTLKNIQDYFNPAALPLMPYLLTMSPSTTVSNKRENKRKFIPPAFANISTKFELLSLGETLQLASELIQTHKLNKDQATALIQIAQMMASRESVEEGKELHTHTLPITVIHGVFGAGKSYLLAVVILFFVQLFEKTEALTVANTRPWKLLISSSTNVAVDRVLLGLLSVGFEKFIRVGSVRKIAKPILPYSLHAGSENENEQLKELHALMKEDLTPVERVYVRKSIEQHKLGTNKTLLKQVRVVGVTCAACPFPCMNDLQFPVVVLDECSQITEPAALLPIARFKCEKLILVGDPKQLPPTIQGSDAVHENGLEQTLFDRLCIMGHKPILLRTQYRCHPAISAIANDLFYEGNLLNGISETERSPLLEWLPTLCFYNVKGLEQIERDNSFHNVAEAAFTLKLIQSLIASGIASPMIGVITLYKSQMYKLCHLLSAVDFDHPNIKSVQVSTVDAFQGAEKEIIILSCVRTRQVGFIDSEKRMNVALTRGKRHLLIVGNLACLRKNRLWGRVIQHCEGSENGLQHASQYEPHLNQLLKDYFEKQAEEKRRKKTEKEKSKDKSHSQKDII